MKKFLAYLLVAAQIICMLPVVTLTHAVETDGTVENPYLISTVDDLKAISTQGLDKHYKLMADIDLSGIANWTPIAATGARFTGSLDGNGYTISNMKVTSVNGQCLGGLFGWIEYPAVVKNLTIDNASINVNHDFGFTSFGGLVTAYNMGGTIDNCQVTGALSVTNAQAKTVYLGGVVGISKTNGADKTATIVNCISDVDITLTCPAGGETYIGGIVAQVSAVDNVAYKAIVANCGYLGDITVNAELTSGTYVADIVGWMESANNASATKSELHNCYSAGSITGLTHAAYAVNTGAIYGRLRYTSVSNVYALSEVAAAHPGVDIQGAASVKGMTMDEMKSEAFVLALADAAEALNSGILASSAAKAMYWMPVEDGYPVQADEKYVPVGGPDGSQNAPYLIYTADDLKAISLKGLDKHYKLMADIDLSGIANWTPIGATGTRFTGSLDGNGYTVSNMKVTSVNGQCLGGLFGWIEYPAVVKNLTIDNASVSVNHDFGFTSFGGLVAAYNMGGTIDNCKVSGALSVTNAQAKEVNLGGIVGISKTNGADKTATIVNCISDVDITLTCPAGGATYIGGIVAQVSAVDNAAYKAIVANCGYLGDITVNAALTGNTYVAGIVGWMESNNNASATKSELHNCYSAGSITGLTHAAYAVNTGAIYGRLRYTTVSNVYALNDFVAEHPGVDIQGAASVKGMTADEMKSEAFVLALADAAEALNSGVLTGSAAKAMYWTPVEDGYPVQSAEKYVPVGGPDGSQDAPYLIYSADDLKAISLKGLDKHYKLMADIDLSGIENWTPIAATGTRFTGSLDGNGYTVSNMKVTGVNGQCLGGLFGWIEYPAVVKNLTIDNASVSVNHDFAYASFGGLVAAYNMGGTIDNCKVTGTLSVTNTQAKEVSLGGIVGISTTTGEDKTATIVNCISDVDITLTCPAGGATYIGGIVAKADATGNAAYKAIVANCGYLGDITVNSELTANTYVAGIVGWMESANNASATKSELHNCYSAGSITGLTHAAYAVNTGAIYGRLRYTSVSNVYALSDIAAAHPGVDIQGAASVTGKTADEMKASAFAQQLSVGAGNLNVVLFEDSAVKLNAWTVDGGYPILTLMEASPEDRWINYASAALTGSGTEADPYQISSAADLAYLAKNSNLTGYYVITANIDLSAREWVPVKNFAGVLDGNNKLITGLCMGKSTEALDADVAGLFESTSSAILKNINITVSIYLAPTSAAKIYAAGLVAKNVSSTIDNCIVNGVIYVDANSKSENAYVGGLTAQNYSSDADKIVKIMNCINNANVTLNTKWAAADIKATHVAGIAADVSVKQDGKTSAWILNCANKGTISTNIADGTYTESSYMGGIVGLFEDTNSDTAVRGELQNCYNYGQINGIVHKLDSSTLPRIQHYVGAVFGRNRYVNKSSLYYLEGTCANGGTNLKLDGDAIALPKDQLQSSAFIVTMNNGAADGNDLLGTSLLEWKAVSGQFPTLTSEKAVATPENKWTDSGKYSSQLTGSGTEADPYLIASAADMAYLAKKRHQSGYFKLTADIDMSAWEWVPIQGFTGTFDGDGHTVKGLWIGSSSKKADKTAAGLFENAKNAVIKNLKIDVAFYLAPTTAGMITAAGLVAKNTSSTIDNCVVNGVVYVDANSNSGAAYVGGLTAHNESSGADKIVKILNCVNNANVTLNTKWAAADIEKKATHVAGIAADVYVKQDGKTSAWILNCANKGTITTNIADGTYTESSYMGGIVGLFEDMNSETAVRGELQNCYNYGQIKGVVNKQDGSTLPKIQHYVGAVFGRNRYVNKSSLYYLEGTCDNGGTNLKLDGDAIALPKDQLQSSAFIVTMNNGAADANDLLGTSLLGWKAVSGQFPILTSEKAVATPENKWTDSGKYSPHLTGSGTEEDPYLIASAADMAYLAKKRNQSGYYKLTADIDMSAWEWVPIQGFTGTFDGNGHTVKGLWIGKQAKPADKTVAGLFENAKTAVIKNLKIDVAFYIAPTTAGMITAAGLVAKNTSSTIDNCVVNGVVYVQANNKSGDAYVGGVTAQNHSSEADKIVKIMNCVNNAAVTLNTKWSAANIKATHVAGIAADVSVQNAKTSAWILNCANKGTITTKIASGTYTQISYMGGIVGRFEDTNSDTAVRGELQNCYNYGQIKGMVHKLDSSTKPTTQHYVGAVFGRNRYVNKSSLYYLEGTCENGGTNLKLDGDAIALPKAKLQSSAFIITMNNGAADANDLLGTSLFGWKAVSGQFPTLTSEKAVATPENKWTDSSKYSSQLIGSGTATDPYLIRSAADMAYLAKKRNQSGYFKLMADIDLSAWEWVPIQGFTGTFDGNGHTIRGMWIGKQAKPADETTAGLFAAATRATIKNVKLKASIYVAPTTTNAIAVAGLVAKNNASLIDNCSVSGVIHVKANAETGGVRVGGIAAAVSSSWDGANSKANNAKIINCINDADIDVVTCWKTRETDYKYLVGGIIAEAYTVNAKCSVWVMNSANTGTINASVAENTYHYQAYIGGVAGWMEATSNTSTPLEFHNCYNIGALTGNITYLVNDAGYVQYVGSIFGRVRNMNSSNLYALHGTYERPGREIFSDGLNEDSGEFKREETMKSAAFVAELSKKARELNQNMRVSARVWGTGEDGWPVLGNQIAQGKIVTVSVNSDRLGSAYLQEKVNGNWKNAFGAMFSKGKTIRVAFDFTSESCYIEKALVNGNEISITSEEYVEIQIDDDTEVEIVFGLHPATKTVELFVKPGAAQNGDGSEAQPFATLQQAADKIVTILEEDANTIIHVNLMDGKHVLQQTLVLNESHSPLAKVVFQNAEGANPIITSGQKIDSSKFKPVAGTDYFAYQFTEADKIDGQYPDFRELQVNGKSATMAKSAMYMLTANVGMDGSFKIPVEAIAGITNENLEGAQLIIASEWQVYGLHFGSIQPETDKFAKLLIEASDWDEYIVRVRTKRNFTGRNFFVQNHIALLDEPGEFYYDQSTGTIYYYPYADENLSDCTVEYAMLDRLIYMENAYNYVFDGLTFTGTSNTRFNHKAMLYGNGAYPIYYYDEGPEEIAGAICGTYTADLTVQNCTFTELDTGGVMFEHGVKNFNIVGNTFRELGMHAIALGSKQLVWNSNDTPGGVEDVLISNNYVDHIGLEVLCATGIRVAKAMNTQVLHNTVKNVPYSGIGMGMGFTVVQPNDNFINLYNVEIAYNHVENYMYNGNDGGAIYICGANATVDYKTTDRVSIHDNYIKANGYDKTAVGIYHDGSSSNVHTYNNVIVDVASSSHGVIFTQWHIENQLAHNILIENNYTTIQAPTCGLGEEYNIVFNNNQVFEDSSKLPAQAQAIIEAAGVDSDHAQVIKPVYLEMTKLDVSVHYDIARYGEYNKGLDTVAKFKLTNNDTVARKLQLMVEGLPEGVTYAVSGDGVLLQPGESATVKVTFAADPETFAPSRAKSMLKLSVVEENGRKMSYPRAISLILKQMPEKDQIGSEGGWFVVTAIALAVALLGAGTAVAVIAVQKKKRQKQ